MPGGFADVRLSPSENVLKEIREEAGIAAEIIGLYSVRNKAKQSHEPDLRDFYRLFFLCRQIDDVLPTASGETSAVSFFAREDLPASSQGRVIQSDIEAAFNYMANQASVLVD